MIYMDNGATSYPKPEAVTLAVKRALDGCIANPGRASHREASRTAMAVFRVRERAADFVNTEPEYISFTHNATMALNVALFGTLRKGDRVLTTPLEHNSVLRPLYRMEREGRITLDFLDVSTYDENVLCKDLLERLEGDEKPTVVVMTHTSNVLGLRLPVERVGAICKDKNVFFVVDGSQGLGSSRIDVEACGIDILCTSGHKGLYGITGSGFMALSRKCRRKPEPLIFGGTGIASREKGMPDGYPERLEAGTLGVVGIESLGAGLEYVTSVGCDAIAEKTKSLRKILTEGLSVIPGVRVYAPESDSVSIVLFNIEGRQCDETASLLDGFDIASRGGLHCSPLAHSFLNTDGAVRLSVSHFNTEAECQTVLSAISHITRGL
ncbi:MAG: aminotransferase class V-fold PLP-dependent enzyme [Clostridia bacterium]|nr:aminotransferase class V-fold PLP-dependent enzyme [Clostridia bacterium]